MTATERYVTVLSQLKAGDLGLLRTHTGKGLDESTSGFDLFAGLWWPLRKESQRAPRRSVAWLIAKLYASRPVTHVPGEEHRLARLLGREFRRLPPGGGERFRQRFDKLLGLPLSLIEPALQRALACIATIKPGLDWVRLTDDLSRWEREATRLGWAEQFLHTNKGEANAD